MKKVTAILLGAGARGRVYSNYAREFPDELEIIAVAEPNAARRAEMAQIHHIAPENVTESWEALLQRPRFADACLICTMDQMHTQPALQALNLGYHVLLEKPMAPTAEECRAIAQAADASGKVLSICHVLRYTPFYSAIKACLDDNTLGDVVTISQTENVGYWHQAHSFVRGNWGNTQNTTPMILQKCCHDTDILSWLLGQRCTHVASYGSLTHFKPENAPAGAPTRCTDNCPYQDSCIYNAPQFYLHHKKAVTDGFTKMLCVDPTPENIMEALRTGPYGRCVYHCDNDAVDHQVLSMEFANGATATLTMCAFSQDCNRTIHIMGTKGELWGDMNRGEVRVQIFGQSESYLLPLEEANSALLHGHNGGDLGLIRNFVHAVMEDDPSKNRSTAQQSLQSHLICFTAEQARLAHTGLDL